MSIEIARFTVEAQRHPDADDDNMQWVVFVKIDFKSADPANWGELRAYGGAWVRKINRTRVKTGERREDHAQVVAPIDIDIEDLDVVPDAVRNLPPWPGYRPTSDRNLMRKDLRLGNDQHIEVFYSKPIPGVPRSYPATKSMRKDPKYLSFDPMVDAEGFDDAAKAERPVEIDRSCHIFGRDEPQRSNFLEPGDFCEYYHAAEFHIRPPQSVHVIQKRKLLLVVKGYYGKLKYLPPMIE